jgi:AraC-like DNA-binding protein
MRAFTVEFPGVRAIGNRAIDLINHDALACGPTECPMARSDPKNVTRYWQDRHLPGLGLMCADFTSHDYPPHTHDALVIAVTESGGAVVKSRGVSEARASTLHVLNPGEPQSGQMGRSRGWRYRAFYLGDTALAEVARGLGLRHVPYFMRNDVADSDLAEKLLLLHRALEQDEALMRQHELLLAALAVLIQRHGSATGQLASPPRDRRKFESVAELMRQRHADNLRLDDLGNAVGLTQFQLIGLFKQMAGMTPHAYLTQVRLNAARRQLRGGTAIADVATAVGFYDQSALTKHFKRCYAITPLQFAKASI